MADAKQIKRIEEMERFLDRSRTALDALLPALDGLEAVQKELQKLAAYYGSERWMKDFEDDEAGKLPPELKRGVLSEDAAYDLLCDYRDLCRRMLRLVSDALDKDLV